MEEGKIGRRRDGGREGLAEIRRRGIRKERRALGWAKGSKEGRRRA